MTDCYWTESSVNCIKKMKLKMYKLWNATWQEVSVETFSTQTDCISGAEKDVLQSLLWCTDSFCGTAQDVLQWSFGNTIRLPSSSSSVFELSGGWEDWTPQLFYQPPKQGGLPTPGGGGSFNPYSVRRARHKIGFLERGQIFCKTLKNRGFRFGLSSQH